MAMSGKELRRQACVASNHIIADNRERMECECTSTIEASRTAFADLYGPKVQDGLMAVVNVSIQPD